MKPQYFNVDVGFYPTAVKLCFSPKAFHQVLKDHNVTLEQDPKPLELGTAETHYFDQARAGLVVLVFNLEDCGNDPVFLASIVAHECNHAIERIMEHVGEKREEIGEETRSYLMGHLVEQVFKACSLEMARYAKRKESRAKARKKSEGAGGPVPEVGGAGDDGRARQIDLFKGSDTSGGVEGSEWSIITKTKTDDKAIVATGDHGFGPYLGR